MKKTAMLAPVLVVAVLVLPSPVQARYLQQMQMHQYVQSVPAPLGRPPYQDGMNLYQYVRSAPIGYVDWSGGRASRAGAIGRPATGPGSQPSPQDVTQEEFEDGVPLSYNDLAAMSQYAPPIDLYRLGCNEKYKFLEPSNVGRAVGNWQVGWAAEGALSATQAANTKVSEATDEIHTRVNPRFKGKCCIVACLLAGEYRGFVAMRPVVRRYYAEQNVAKRQSIQDYLTAMKDWWEVPNGQEAVACLNKAILTHTVGPVQYCESETAMLDMRQQIKAWLAPFVARTSGNNPPQPPWR